MLLELLLLGLGWEVSFCMGVTGLMPSLFSSSSPLDEAGEMVE